MKEIPYMLSKKARKSIAEHTATAGGGISYREVRSKISRGKDGYGKVVSVAREKMMQKLGKDPGKDIVAAHKNPGAHREKGGGAAEPRPRGENTAESNKKRSKKNFKQILEKLAHG
jgi:hypothetical protein